MQICYHISSTNKHTDSKRTITLTLHLQFIDFWQTPEKQASSENLRC